MKMPTQTTRYAETILKKLLKNNQSENISRLFTRLRSYKRLSNFGDFQILHLIISTIAGLKIEVRKSNLLYAYNKSEELKRNTKEEKHDDINNLFNLLKPVKNQPSFRQNFKDVKEVDQFSVRNSLSIIYA